MSALLLLASMSMAENPKVLVHGHRGARAVLPEGTIPAFEHAISSGVDVLELDLAVTKDNVLVVSHDPVLRADLCKGPRARAVIREMTLAEVRQYDCGSLKHPDYPKQRPVPGARIPTLDEVFSLASKGDFEFNVETKISSKHPELTPSPEDFANLVVKAIRKHKLKSRVMVQSFDFRTLHAMKKIAPEIRLSALYEGAPRDFVEIAKEAGATIVSPKYTLVTRAQVQAAHRAGLQVVPWTANTEQDWRRLIDAGVDAIITDDPAALVQYLKSRGLR